MAGGAVRCQEASALLVLVLQGGGSEDAGPLRKESSGALALGWALPPAEARPQKSPCPPWHSLSPLDHGGEDITYPAPPPSAS